MKKLFETITDIGPNKARWALIVLLGAAGAATAGLTPKELADPDGALQSSSTPLNTVESLLILETTAPVQNYYETLLAEGKADAANRVRCLQELYAGNDAGAQQALEILGGVDAWATSRKNYLTGLALRKNGFVEARSDHFTVRVSSEDAFLADIALRALENARAKFVELWGDVSEIPGTIEIYSTVENFAFAAALPPESVGLMKRVTADKFGRWMVLSPRLYPWGYPWVDALVREYAHRNIVRLTAGRAPTWLMEGFSRYLAVSWRSGEEFSLPLADQVLLGAAASPPVVSTGTGDSPELTLGSGSAFIPWSDYPSNPDFFYTGSLASAQAVHGVSYLVAEHGIEKGRALLNAFRSPEMKDPFAQILGATEPELEGAWRESLAEEKFPSPTGALPAVWGQTSGDDTALPMSAEARDLIRQGDRLRQQNKITGAAASYKKVLEFEPDNAVALTRLAQSYLLAGRVSGILPLLERAQAKNPSYVPPSLLMAEMYFDEGRYEEAQGVLQQALEVHPFHPKIHEILGLIAVDVGNFVEARRLLGLTLRLDPENDAVREALQRMPKRR